MRSESLWHLTAIPPPGDARVGKTPPEGLHGQGVQMVRGDGIAGGQTGLKTAAQIDEMQDQGNVGSQPDGGGVSRPPRKVRTSPAWTISWAKRMISWKVWQPAGEKRGAWGSVRFRGATIQEVPQAAVQGALEDWPPGRPRGPAPGRGLDRRWPSPATRVTGAPSVKPR